MNMNDLKKKPTTPWKPASILNANIPNDGFRYKWVRQNKLDKLLAEGAEIVNRANAPKGFVTEKTLIDGSNVDGIVRKREMVLVRMPEELAQSREEYFRKMTQFNIESEKSTYLKEVGEYGYGSVRVQNNILEGGNK